VRSGSFAKASLSRLGKNSITLPWFLLLLSLRRRAFVLSDEASRLSENPWEPVVFRFIFSSGEEQSRSREEVLPKREFMKPAVLFVGNLA